jgi:hypothetical protein
MGPRLLLAASLKNLTPLMFVNFDDLPSAPPPRPLVNNLSTATRIDKNPTTGLTMGRLEVFFEKTRLKDVLVAAGGELSQQGDGAEHVFWICYTILDAKQSARLWIISNAEMGGREHAVTSVAAQLEAVANPTQTCPALPATLQPVSFSNGVWLGIAGSRASAFFGDAPYHNEPIQTFVYRGKVPGKCESDGFDVLNWLEWKVNDGFLVQVYAGQVTSC